MSVPGSTAPASPASAVHDLQVLAVALSRDPALRLEVAEGTTWAYRPREHVVVVGRDDLSSRPAAWLNAVLSHEVGHVLCGRYFLFPWGRRLPPEIQAPLLNAIEDVRCERYISLALAGAADWLAHTYESDLEEACGKRRRDRFAQFCVGAILDRFEGDAIDRRKLFRRLGIRRDVRAALDRTRAARLRHARTLPPPSREPTLDPDASLHAYARKVAGPIQRRFRDAEETEREAATRTPVSPLEREVRLSAYDAHRVYLREILPVVHDLVSTDVKAITRRRKGRGGAAARKRIVLVIGTRAAASLPARVRQSAAVRARATAGHGEEPMDGWRRLRLELLEREPRSRLERWYRDKLLERKANTYERLVAPVRGHVEALVSELEHMLPAHGHRRWERGFVSGRRLDIARAAEAVAAPHRRTAALWARRGEAQGRHAAVLLLVDLSGSMQGEKIAQALRATVLLVEALVQFRVDLAVWGFQDRPLPIVGFDVEVDDAARAAIVRAELEVRGLNSGPGANNRPEHNDDGPALDAAAACLLERDANDRLLIVISDGSPSGAHSTPADLSKAVHAIESAGEVYLVAIGIGDGHDVASFYPRYVECQDVSRLPCAMGAVLASWGTRA